MFEWVGDFMRWAAAFFIHWKMCPPTHRAVRVSLKGALTENGPGNVVYIPAFQELYLMPVVRDSEDYPIQHLTTLDEKPISMSVNAAFRVVDPVATMSLQWELQDTIRDVVMGLVQKEVASRSFRELLREGDKSQRRLENRADDILRPFGVEILSIERKNFCITKMIAVLGEGSAPIVPDEEDDE